MGSKIFLLGLTIGVILVYCDAAVVVNLRSVRQAIEKNDVTAPAASTNDNLSIDANTDDSDDDDDGDDDDDDDDEDEDDDENDDDDINELGQQVDKEKSDQRSDSNDMTPEGTDTNNFIKDSDKNIKSHDISSTRMNAGVFNDDKNLVHPIELNLSFLPLRDGDSSEFRPSDARTHVATQQSFIYKLCQPSTKSEIEELTENLFDNDTNNAYKYITMNLAGRKSNENTKDEAPGPLLKVDEEAYRIPTIRSLLLLHDNYKYDVKFEENVMLREQIEEEKLIELFMETKVMRLAMEFLVKKCCMPNSKKTIKEHLKSIWFSQYGMFKNRPGSSGFESVFLAEEQDSVIYGMHNWIYYAKQEKAKRLNYLGYTNEVKLGKRGAIVKVRSSMNSIVQDTSIFVGTSPELEMALYTICFFTHPMLEPCPVKLGDSHFTIQASRFNNEGKEIMLSAFPII